MQYPIVVKNLSKNYSNKAAVKNINFKINKNEILGLLGPNGCGKTTTIAMMLGLLKPTNGIVLIDGEDIEKNRIKLLHKMNFISPYIELPKKLTVKENLIVYGKLYGVKKVLLRIDYLSEKLRLTEFLNKKTGELSSGQKNRVSLAKALINDPKILFLDEPSAGVDVELRQEMWQIIYKLKEEGVTIILTTHYIEEAEEIADRVGFINDGKIILVEEKKKLLAKLGNKTLVLKLSKQLKKPPSFLNNYSTQLNKLGKELEINLDNRKNQAIDILALIKKNKLNFLDFDIKKRSLESIFINFIKGNKK